MSCPVVLTPTVSPSPDADGNQEIECKPICRSNAMTKMSHPEELFSSNKRRRTREDEGISSTANRALKIVDDNSDSEQSSSATLSNSASLSFEQPKSLKERIDERENRLIETDAEAQAKLTKELEAALEQPETYGKRFTANFKLVPFIENEELQEAYRNGFYFTNPKTKLEQWTSMTIERGSKSIEGHKVGWFSVQGVTRPTFEDACFAQAFSFDAGGKTNQATLVGVLDGHGSIQAAEYCKTHLPSIFKTQLLKHNRTEISDKGMINAIKMTTKEIDLQFRNEHPTSCCGTTATFSLILGNTIWVGNVGDARTILCENGKGTPLSTDAKPDHPRFAKGIMRRGGVINGGLITTRSVKKPPIYISIARAIGNGKYMENNDGVRVITSRAKVTKTVLDTPGEKTVLDTPGERYLVLACDGVWDVVVYQILASHLNQAVKKDTTLTSQGVAELITCGAFNNRSKDNITTLVVKLASPS